MSRTIKGSKPMGFEYWSARPGNKCGGHYSTRNAAGKQWQKKATNKAERVLNKSERWDG
ncbi:MAG: hypothetical protein V4493_01220 [Pseudomonadota bacterium]